MELKKLFSRWRRGLDEEALEKATEETRMTPYVRDVDQEDYEARKDDALVTRDFAGAEALEAADDDVEDRPGPGI